MTEHMISELWGKGRGVAVLIGGGLSRRAPDVANACIKLTCHPTSTSWWFGCNDIWRDETYGGGMDFVAARDEPALHDLLEWENEHAKIFVTDRRWDRNLDQKIADFKGAVYRYSTTREFFARNFNPRRMSDGSRVPRRIQDTLDWGSNGGSGYFLLQVAHRMGYREVFLVGYDGCILPEETSAHVRLNEKIKKRFNQNKDLRRLSRRTPEGVECETYEYLLKFTRDVQRYAEYMMKNGIKVFKVGRYGMLDLPVYGG